MPNGYSYQCAANHYPYVVQPGDTLYKIANAFGVTVAGIFTANPGINPNNLIIGQVICIPVCPPNCFPIEIQPGDTIYRLAQIYKVSVRSVLEANPGIDPNSLRVGQRICMPMKCDCEDVIAAMQRDIDMLVAESSIQQTEESNYGSSSAKTTAVTVTDMLLQFGAVPVVFTDDYSNRFFEGYSYPYYIESAMGGRRSLVVKDNFGVWHSFNYTVELPLG